MHYFFNNHITIIHHYILLLHYHLTIVTFFTPLSRLLPSSLFSSSSLLWSSPHPRHHTIYFRNHCLSPPLKILSPSSHSLLSPSSHIFPLSLHPVILLSSYPPLSSPALSLHSPPSPSSHRTSNHSDITVSLSLPLLRYTSRMSSINVRISQLRHHHLDTNHIHTYILS